MTHTDPAEHEPTAAAAASLPPRMTRRNLLGLGLALAGGALLPAVNALALVAAPAGDPMLAAVADPAAATRLGHAYLAAYPAEADAERLRGLLRQTLFADLSMTTDDSDALCRGLVRTLSDDYIAGEVLDLDGWQISRSEARLYALAALYLQ